MSDTGPQLKASKSVTGRARGKARHHFYFYDMVYIEVENTQYFVPKMGLNQPGTTFHDMFSLPPGEAKEASDRKEVEGSSEDNPIVLPVSNRNFQAFLQVLYPAGPEVGGPGSPATVGDWSGALELSTMWRFTKIRKQAIRAIDRILELRNSPTDYVLLGRKHHVAGWVLAGYKALAQVPVDEFDWRRLQVLGLDLPTICDISAIRQRMISQSLGSGSSLEFAGNPGGWNGDPLLMCIGCDKRLGRYWNCKSGDSSVKFCEKCFKTNEIRSLYWSASTSKSADSSCSELVLSTFEDELKQLEIVQKELSGE